MDTASIELIIMVIILLAALIIMFFMGIYMATFASAQLAAMRGQQALARTKDLIDQATMLDFGRDMIANQEMSKINDLRKEKRGTTDYLADEQGPLTAKNGPAKSNH